MTLPRSRFRLFKAPLAKFGIDERMSWAKMRQTKRGEDKAYSLLGLFNVSMPLIYGEGEDKAFRRLQKEIHGGKHPSLLTQQATAI